MLDKFILDEAKDRDSFLNYLKDYDFGLDNFHRYAIDFKNGGKCATIRVSRNEKGLNEYRVDILIQFETELGNDDWADDDRLCFLEASEDELEEKLSEEKYKELLNKLELLVTQ